MDNPAITPAVLEVAHAIVHGLLPAQGNEPQRTKPYRVGEVAAMLDVHRATVYRDVSEGRCRALRVGKGQGVIRIPVDAFNEYRQRLEVQAVAPSEVVA